MIDEVEGQELDGKIGDLPVPHPAVIILRVPIGEGKTRIEIMEINGIDGLAVPSLLRMAANLKEENLGITKGMR